MSRDFPIFFVQSGCCSTYIVSRNLAPLIWARDYLSVMASSKLLSILSRSMKEDRNLPAFQGKNILNFLPSMNQSFDCELAARNELCSNHFYVYNGNTQYQIFSCAHKLLFFWFSWFLAQFLITLEIIPLSQFQCNFYHSTVH